MTKNLLSVALASAVLFGSSSVFAERQPLMNEALRHLRAAEQALMSATRDKGGHRRAALASVRMAIEEVRKGKRFDNRH